MVLGKPSRRPLRPVSMPAMRCMTSCRCSSLRRSLGALPSWRTCRVRVAHWEPSWAPSSWRNDRDKMPPSKSPTVSSRPPTTPVPGRAGTLPSASGHWGWPGRPQGSWVNGWWAWKEPASNMTAPGNWPASSPLSGHRSGRVGGDWVAKERVVVTEDSASRPLRRSFHRAQAVSALPVCSSSACSSSTFLCSLPPPPAKMP